MIIKYSTKILVTILILIFFNSILYAEEKVRISVLRLETDNVPATIVTQVTEIVTSSFMEYELLEIIEREKLQKIMEQQEINMTSYSETEKNVSAAKIAKVDKIITGNINQITDNYYLNLSMIDVATGKIEQTSNTSFKEIHSSSDDIKIAVDRLENKISGVTFRQTTNQKIKVTRKETGDINFKFDASMYFFSFAGVNLVYDINNTENIMDDWKIGWHVLDMAFGKRYALFGSSVYKDFGDDETFLPLTIRIPLLIYPTETFRENNSTYEATPAGLYLEGNYAWLNTDKYDRFCDLKLIYDNGSFFNFFGSIIFREDFSTENMYIYAGVSFYLGTYGMSF